MTLPIYYSRRNAVEICDKSSVFVVVTHEEPQVFHGTSRTPLGSSLYLGDEHGRPLEDAFSVSLDGLNGPDLAENFVQRVRATLVGRPHQDMDIEATLVLYNAYTCFNDLSLYVVFPSEDYIDILDYDSERNAKEKSQGRTFLWSELKSVNRVMKLRHPDAIPMVLVYVPLVMSAGGVSGPMPITPQTLSAEFLTT